MRCSLGVGIEYTFSLDMVIQAHLVKTYQYIKRAHQDDIVGTSKYTSLSGVTHSIGSRNTL
jgi:hypothetical protein